MGFPWWAAASNPDDKQVDIVDRFADSGLAIQNEKTKRPGDRDFLLQKFQDSPWEYYTAPLALRMRNAVPRDNNPKGSLFTQEEIPERTRFIADIYFPNTETARQCLKSLMPFFGAECLEVGRGGAPMLIEAAEWIPETVKDKPTDPASNQGESGKKLEILLTSDLIARNETLAFLETLDPATLARLCDLSPDRVNTVSRRAAYADTVEIHGFNALTGLPRLPALALRRGSAFCFAGPSNQIDALRSALEALTDKGLGERCREGYGNFALDFRNAAKPGQIYRLAYAGAVPEDNSLEIAIQHAQYAWLELDNKAIALPALVHWQHLRAAATLGETELENRLKQFLGDCDKLAKRELAVFVKWLLDTLKNLPIAVNHTLFYRQLLHLYVIHRGNQGEQP